MKKTFSKVLPYAVLLLAPSASFAATSGRFDTLYDALRAVGDFINALVPIIIGIAFLTFLWGVGKYVTAKDEDGQKEARGTILWGIIILFVMVSVWGLVNVLRSTLGLDTGSIPTAPPAVPNPTRY